MESPPAVEHVPTHGTSTALQSNSPDFRTLMEESQGARPLSNIFGYRNSRNSFNMSLRRSPYGQLFAHESFSVHGVSHPVEPSVNQQQQQHPYVPPAERLQDEDFQPFMYSDQIDPIGLHSYVEPSNLSNSNPAEPPTHYSSMSRHSQIDLVTSYQPVLAESRSRKRNHDGVDHSSRKRPALAPLSTVPPGNLKTDVDELSDAGSCCICMCDPEEGELARIDGCDHSFCFTCIEKWAERENTCPLCKIRFQRINRVDKSKRKKGQKGTKKVKERNQRADLNSSNALEGLLAGLHANNGFSSSIARLIFSGIGSSSGTSLLDFGVGPLENRWSRSTNTIHPSRHVHFESDEASEDDHFGYTDFVNAVRTNNHRESPLVGMFPHPSDSMSDMMSSQRRMNMGTSPFSIAPLSAHSTRSYATNSHVANVGGTAENALEIDSDSDEDEVEVVDVRISGSDFESLTDNVL